MDSHNQDPERDLNTTQATNDTPHQDSAQTPPPPPPPEPLERVWPCQQIP